MAASLTLVSNVPANHAMSHCALRNSAKIGSNLTKPISHLTPDQAIMIFKNQICPNPAIEIIDVDSLDIMEAQQSFKVFPKDSLMVLKHAESVSEVYFDQKLVIQPKKQRVFKFSPNNPVLNQAVFKMVEEEYGKNSPPIVPPSSCTYIFFYSAAKKVHSAIPQNNFSVLDQDISSNKPLSGYFLLSVFFHTSLDTLKVIALVDNDATCKLISKNLDDKLCIDYHPSGLVKGGASQIFPSFRLTEPLSFHVEKQEMIADFSVVNQLVYPIILGVNWWRKHNVSKLLCSNTMQLTHPDGLVLQLSLVPQYPDNELIETLPLVKSLAPEITKALPDCLSGLAVTFDANRAHGLPSYTDFDFNFKLTSLIYPINLKEEECLEEWTRDMEAKGQIFRKTSPVCSPLLFVQKADGTLRPCVDYGNLNNVTVPDPYPLPLESQISRYVEKARVFSKLDLLNAFNQIRIKKDQEWLTAFQTKCGIF